MKMKEMPEVEIEMEDGEEGSYGEHELECDARTIFDAEKIKADSKKMSALKPYLAKLAKAADGIKSIADLREVAKKKLAE